MSFRRMHPDEMPEPDALITYPECFVGPAMFHYLVSEDPAVYKQILEEHGFEVTGYHLPEDDPLFKLYEEKPQRFFASWNPPVPLGWKMGGKHATDGAMMWCVDIPGGSVSGYMQFGASTAINPTKGSKMKIEFYLSGCSRARFQWL